MIGCILFQYGVIKDNAACNRISDPAIHYTHSQTCIVIDYIFLVHKDWNKLIERIHISQSDLSVYII